MSAAQPIYLQSREHLSGRSVQGFVGSRQYQVDGAANCNRAQLAREGVFCQAVLPSLQI